MSFVEVLNFSNNLGRRLNVGGRGTKLYRKFHEVFGVVHQFKGLTYLLSHLRTISLKEFSHKLTRFVKIFNRV